MAHSMTGYGRGEATLHNRTITVEVRSVNNRYLDTSVKMPRMYIFAEDAIKTRVQNGISRGKVDVFISIDGSGTQGVTVRVNKEVADAYMDALCSLRDDYGWEEIPFGVLTKFPDVLVLEKASDDVDEVAADLIAVLDIALSDFNTMRLREGERLKADILSRAETIERLTAIVEAQGPKTVADYRARLENKMKEVLQNTQLDESRILTEAAIFSDKIAVDEETVRLRSHLAQLDTLLAQEGPVGRKLDFLIQEFNREANTIGSKCNDIEISRHVIDIKSEIEKIREQVQNLE